MQSPVAAPRPKPDPRRAPQRRSPASALLAVGVLLVCVLGVVSGGRRLAGEAWIGDPSRASLERATAWLPDNPAGWMKLAALAAREDGEPGAAIDPLGRLIELRPEDSAARVEMALALESVGNLGETEQRLLEAAEIDPGFAPRWSLANFFLRQGREDDYWEWTQRSLRADFQQLPAVMDLCWRAFDDGDLILEKGVPDIPNVNRAYFEYLIDSRELGSMLTIWPRLEPDLTAADLPNVSLYLDRLLLADQVEQAVEVWNRMCERQFLPFQKLSLDDGPFLTNGDFKGRISGLGFDWKIPPAEGVTRIQSRNEDGEFAFEIRLSGGQAEYTQLLLQLAPVRPGVRYVLIYEYATQQLPAETGIGWVVRDGRTEQVISEPAPLENAEKFWYETSFSFDVPADVSLLRLELKYQRVPGTTRQRGRLVMRNLRLETLETPPPGTTPLTGQGA